MQAEMVTFLRASFVGRSFRWLRHQTALSYQAIPMAPRMARGVVNALLARSDNTRWSNQANLEGWWEARTVKLAAFLPKGARIIEFGAGQCRLPQYLESDCTYFASDLVPRIAGTIVCDLNQRPLPNLGYLRLDVTFFAGVLEYIADLPAVTAWLATQAPMCVVSYDAVDSERWSAQRLTERARRKYFGYMNAYEPAEFVRVFEAAGFRCTRTDRWNSQELYLFEKAPA